MSKVKGGSPIVPPQIFCKYFFFKASRVKGKYLLLMEHIGIF